MDLRGFDTYEVTLGDEIRGERACLGKTLHEAQRDLCIRVEMLEGIENADLSPFPNRSVVPGYVRSYARYLGMDPEDVYRRFCEETGFQSSLVTFGMTPQTGGTGREQGVRVVGPVGADFTASRFAVRPAPKRVGATVSLGGIASGVALLALVTGLGYGGYAVLQDIQRVGFAPLPEAPAVVADAPLIAAPAFAAEQSRPNPGVYDDDGVLVGFISPEALSAPAQPRRDGPISAIDPATSGIFRGDRIPELAVARLDGGVAPSAGLSRPYSAPVAPLTVASVEVVQPEPEDVVATPAAPPGVAVVVTDRAWIRVQAGAGAILFEGILEAGQSFELPERVDRPVIRAGNAGGVQIRIGGERFGPLGRPGQVVKNVSLVPEDVRGAYGVAEAAPDAGERIESAEARVAD